MKSLSIPRMRELDVGPVWDLFTNTTLNTQPMVANSTVTKMFVGISTSLLSLSLSNDAGQHADDSGLNLSKSR